MPDHLTGRALRIDEALRRERLMAMLGTLFGALAFYSSGLGSIVCWPEPLRIERARSDGHCRVVVALSRGGDVTIVLPANSNWPVVVVALALMAAPVVHVVWRMRFGLVRYATLPRRGV